MKYSISDLLDMDYTPEEYELEDPAITTASRIEAMTLLAIHAKARKHPRRIGRTLLIAAVIALLLAVGAVAVYHYGLKDAVIEGVGPLPSQTDEREIYLSQNGFSDSPECMAYTEWNDWNNAWTSEHKNRYAELGVDDSWYETPENYAHLYGATFAEQAEKLDEILDKYDLTAHTQRWSFRAGSELYGALGTEPFIADAYTIGGEYYYDDGSFKVYGYADEGDWDSSFELVTTVKGSFTQITLGLHEDTAEQEYRAADGTALILFTEESTDRAGFIFSAEGCYVTAVIYTSDEQQVKALADAIDFTAIAALFETPQAREATAASVAAYDEVFTAAESVEGTEAESLPRRNSLSEDERFDQAVALYQADYYPLPVSESAYVAYYYSLGCYAPTSLPEGYTHTGDVAYRVFEENVREVMTRSFRTEQGGHIRLSYKRCSAEDVSELEATRAEFDAEREYREQFGPTVDQTVNGCEGYFSNSFDRQYETEETQRCLDWLDTDRGIWFILTCSEDIGDEALLAIAESVVEAEIPERFVYDLGDPEQLPVGGVLGDGLTYDLATEELGDLYIPSLHDRVLAGTQRGRYEQNMFYWYLEAEPCAYDGITTLYRDGIALEYTRYWTDDSCTAGRGGRSYADMKRFYGAAYEGDGFRDGLTVSGSDAFALVHDGWNELIWYDAERDLVLTLSDSLTTDDKAYSVQELIALAESIQEQ